MTKILLVDDVSAIRSAIGQLLVEAGYEVTACASVAEAITALNGSRFHIVITDLLLPEKDGYELITYIRDNFNRMRVIVITGGGESVSSEEAIKKLKIDVDVRLQKPFGKKELLAAVKAALQAAR